jgi:hypothetical protein
MVWDYKVSTLPFRGKGLQEYLNDYGSEGWELVQVVSVDGGVQKCIFKRPRP